MCEKTFTPPETVTDDSVRVFVTCGNRTVGHILTGVMLDHLRDPKVALGALMHELVGAVRQKDPS